MTVFESRFRWPIFSTPLIHGGQCVRCILLLVSGRFIPEAQGLCNFICFRLLCTGRGFLFYSWNWREYLCKISSIAEGQELYLIGLWETVDKYFGRYPSSVLEVSHFSCVWRQFTTGFKHSWVGVGQGHVQNVIEDVLAWGQIVGWILNPKPAL